MIGRFGEVSVVDWGIAKRLETRSPTRSTRRRPRADEVPREPCASAPFRTRVGSLLGTPAYMSPEQARGDNHLLDERSDIFSVCVIFYELLTLHHTVRRSPDLAGLLEAVRTDEPASLALH